MKKINCKNIAGGCASKVEPKILSNILSKFPKDVNPNLLVGFEFSDDACIYKLQEDLALVQTLDFFPSMVEDPYLFGQIAATNALSDVYAMGGEPITAMNIVCFPKEEDKEILQEILRGGVQKIQEAGASLSGGHSIYDEKIKYGLSVTGLVNPKKIWKNVGAQEGDYLYYTKRLGMGIMTTANNHQVISEEDFKEVSKEMTTLNKYANKIMKNYDIHACTDVTGFSLLGHSIEMLQDNQDISFVYDYFSIPKFSNVEKYSKEDYICGGGLRNRDFFEKDINLENLEEWEKNILFDPQTSGGLLFAIGEVEAKALENEFLEKKLELYLIGKVSKRLDKKIIVNK